MSVRRRFTALALLGAVLATVARADDMMEAVGLYHPIYFAELQELDVVDDLLYVFGVGGLDIVDFDDVDQPVSLGRYEPSGHPYVRYYRGAVGGGYAYCGAREDLLHVIDATDPTDPRRVTTWGTPGESYEGAVLHAGYLYAARHGDGVAVLDLADPGAPVLAAEVGGLVNAWDAAVLGTRVYVADGAGGLAVLDASDPAAPVHVATVATSGNALDVATAPGLVAVACGSSGVDLFDVSDPDAPVRLSTYDSAGLAVSIELDGLGGWLFLADWLGLEVVDISDTGAPSLYAHENTPVRAMGVAHVANRVYAADWSRVRAYDVRPSLTGDLELSLEGVAFGAVPVGATVDTVLTASNTGGAPVSIISLGTFSPNFTLDPDTPFTLAPGESRDITISFHHAEPGYDATYLQLACDDWDEFDWRLPLTADDDPNALELGEPAPGFELTDLGGATHSLSQYLGKVVVVAFFANW